jgi:8-amino-7-oxononanoate synthase
MKARFLAKLAERKEKGSLRSLSLFEGYADFCSNDYLGIARTTDQAYVHAGSTGSRLISGHTKGAAAAEAFLAKFFRAEAALIFNSGYDANVGLFSSVPQKGDTVLYDELIHASVRDGIRLSHAKAWSFGHNDLNDLRKKLALAEGTVFVAVESLYSMDGDFAPLAEIAALCEEQRALLIVDEAHSGGIFGNQGRGLAEELQLHERCFARLVTFGKAYGTHGAAVLGSEDLCEYLCNFARSFIYTTALPEAQYAHIVRNVERAAAETASHERLRENIALFRSLVSARKMLSDPRSPIQIFPVETLEQCLLLTEELQKCQLAVKAILPPTVPENGQRLRICLHAHNTTGEIERLVSLI